MFTQIVEIRVNEQITELITKFPQAKLIDRQSRVIKIPVTTNRSIPGFTIFLKLPNDYPKVVPTISVGPTNVEHPWIQKNAAGKVWFDALPRYGYQHDELVLVKLVAALFDAFKSATLPGGGGSQYGMQGQSNQYHYPQQAAGGPQQQPPPQQQSQQQSKPPVPGMDISYEDITKDLSKLSSEELVNLLTNKEAYAKYVANMKELSNMGSSIKELVMKNQAVAESSQEKQSQIAELKNQIAIIRSTEVLEVKNRYEELAKEHNSKLSSVNVNTLKEKLSEAANDQDQASEDLSEKLMDKSLSVEKFVDGYCKSRELYHKRTMVLSSLDH